MVTRSIVGRFLILAVLVVSLGVIAQAAMFISKDAGKKVAKADAPPIAGAPAAMASADTAATPAKTATTADAAPVRVVYPGPLGDAPAARKIADAAPASPLPNPAAPPPAPAASATTIAAVAAAAPQPAAAAVAKPAPLAAVASADPAAAPSPDAAPQPAAQPATNGGVNLNSASIDALNHLGGGRIGQTIVQHRPYRSVDDLMKKRVVRRSVYEQIKNQVAAQ